MKLIPQELDKLTVQSAKCFWHPLYQTEKQRLIYSQIHPEQSPPCPGDQVNQEATDASVATIREYIGESICSETEFPISNGRGKILALPAGMYRYEISVNPAPFANPNKSKVIEKFGEGS